MQIDDTRDRVISLGRDVEHLTAVVDKMSTQLGEMHDAFNQAKGRGWIYMSAFSILVGIISANARFIWQTITGAH